MKLTKRDRFYKKVRNRIWESEFILRQGKHLRDTHFGEDETVNVMREVRKMAIKEQERAKRNLRISIINETRYNEIILLNKEIEYIANQRIQTQKNI